MFTGPYRMLLTKKLLTQVCKTFPQVAFLFHPFEDHVLHTGKSGTDVTQSFHKICAVSAVKSPTDKITHSLQVIIISFHNKFTGSVIHCLRKHVGAAGDKDYSAPGN